VNPAPAARTPWLLYVGLTLAACGLFAFDRRPWHDDVQNLFRALAAPGRGEGWFPLLASPTRKLLSWPFFLALGSGWPSLALETMCVLSWLATGVLADRLARRLWPGQAGAAPLAGALTLVATSDFFTAATVAVGYLLSVTAFLAAVEAGFAWLHGARPPALVLALAMLSASLWTTDVAAPAFVLAPLLWAVGRGAAPRARLGRLAAAWYLAGAPYVALLLAQLAAPGSYVRAALAPVTLVQRAASLARLAAWNFEPWAWAFDRPLWQVSPGHVVPPGVRLALAAAAGLGAAWTLRRAHFDGARVPVRPALVCLTLMLASNAAFAGVPLSESFCRTHLLSRVWASLALAGWLGWTLARAGRWRWPRALALTLVAAWVALGAAGGLERQDYYVAYARRHVQELRSILVAAPALAPDARVVLRVPRAPAYMATDAGYLARARMALLYADPSLECRVVLWSDARGTRCEATPDGLLCRGERSPDCRRADGRDFDLLPWDRLVFLEYQSAYNWYLARDVLPDELGGRDPSIAERYAPERQIRSRPPSALAYDLVLAPGGLAAWLWP
jgi:hypothetical protein